MTSRYIPAEQVDHLEPHDLGRVHMIAIGGSGMSVIAELLAERGVPVQGSDAHDSTTVQSLRARGITVWVGHDPSHVAGADTVVVSSAIKDDNVELQAAQAAGLPVLHRSQALAILMHGRRAVTVAGTHGKSTTSAMIATALRTLGADPSMAIGASIRTPDGRVPGGHAGSGDVFVAEADESDGSFLAYRPTVTVITNVEADHLDHYGTPEAVEEAFAAFAARIRPGGTLVACADDPGARRVLAGMPADGPARITYGVGEGCDLRVTDIVLGSHSEPEEDAAARPESAEQSAVVARATVVVDGVSIALVMRVPGRHNLLNAAGALGAIRALGYDLAAAARALGEFRGAGRRFELVAERAGVRVFTDYAHHPTEVAAVIAAARSVVDGGRVLVVFQPHLFSRTRIFAQQFADALAGADDVLVCDIYAAREAPDPTVSAATVVTRAPAGAHMAEGGSPAQAARTMARRARPGDVLVLVGAGDIDQSVPLVVDVLAAAERSQ